MAVYSISNEQGGTAQNLTSTALSIIQNNNTTTACRCLVQDIIVRAAAQGYTSTDTPITYDAVRSTTTGTGATATNGVALDTTFRAALTTGWSNHTATATIAAAGILVSMALNQRASQRWVAAPGSELV